MNVASFCNLDYFTVYTDERYIEKPSHIWRKCIHYNYEISYHFNPGSTHRDKPSFCRKYFNLVKQSRVMDFNPLKLLCLG